MKNSLSISPKLVFLALTALSLVIVIVHVALLVWLENYSAVTYYGPLSIFNLNNEVSIPTWFAQSLLLLAAALFVIIGKSSAVLKKYWYGLAAIFVFLSLDEGSSVHELLSVPIRQSLEISSGPFFYSWIIGYGLLILLLAVIYLRFFWSLPRQTKIGLLLAATIFIIGAVGFESWGGSLAAENGEFGLAYNLSVVLEELSEMMGAVLLIGVLMKHLSQSEKLLELEFKD